MGQLNFHQRLATIASRAGLHEPIHHAPKINNNNWKKKKKKEEEAERWLKCLSSISPHHSTDHRHST
jgi:hypothetical protein